MVCLVLLFRFSDPVSLIMFGIWYIQNQQLETPSSLIHLWAALYEAQVWWSTGEGVSSSSSFCGVWWDWITRGGPEMGPILARTLKFRVFNKSIVLSRVF